ncbi:uncharacterized protein LOC144114581 [Amblyomma americanum]
MSCLGFLQSGVATGTLRHPWLSGTPEQGCRTGGKAEREAGWQPASFYSEHPHESALSGPQQPRDGLPEKRQCSTTGSEPSQHRGARPKYGLSSRLTAQFPEQFSTSPEVQVGGRGPVPGGSAEGPQIPRQRRTLLPAYI